MNKNLLIVNLMFLMVLVLSGAKGCGNLPYFDTKVLDFNLGVARDYEMVNRRNLEFKFKGRSPIQSADSWICVSPKSWGTIREEVVGGN